MAFSPLTTRSLMAARNLPSVLSSNVPTALWVKSIRNCSLQHSNSCMILSAPANFVTLTQSSQWDVKYCQSSLVPAEDAFGHFTFSILAVVALASGLLCTVAPTVIRAAATTGSLSGITYGNLAMGQSTTGIIKKVEVLSK